MQVENLNLKTMQHIVGGYIEVLVLSQGIDLYFNEMGRLKGLPPNRMFGRYDILGDAFIAASTEDGETVGLTPEQAAEWLDKVRELPVAVF
jgi:hypothetical protein